MCARYDIEGILIAQVIKDGSTGLWAVFDTQKMNSTRTGYLRVAGGFPNAAAAKAFVDEAPTPEV